MKLTKADARRAMVRHHFSPVADIAAAFDRLRSIQFDPISPVGCNHDLVLQARVPSYRVGDWEKVAYQDRLVYDGWDKQASLVPFSGWAWRRLYHDWYLRGTHAVLQEHPDAIETILKELEARGPLMPKECEFQARREEWKGSWHGPNVSKQALRHLWYAGRVMTAGRRGGHHVYDLAERIVPPEIYSTPRISEEDAVRELVLERHRAVGLLRPGAAAEVWSYQLKTAPRRAAIANLIARGELVEVDLDGVQAHATAAFLAQLDRPSLDPTVTFVAPLDQMMWDRRMIGHLFGFEYVWEIYMPEAKRRWGYYVLPVRYGDDLVARVEFRHRKGTLEIVGWHWEPNPPDAGFMPALGLALSGMMRYCGATAVVASPTVDAGIAQMASQLRLESG